MCQVSKNLIKKVKFIMLKKSLTRNISTLLFSVFISLSFGIYSSQASEKHGHEKEHEHEKRQLDSHEHGVSTLKIAIEGRDLNMELESPANDIVGFEHAPENKNQKDTIQKALSQLKNMKGIFLTPTNAECIIMNVSGEFEVEKDHAGFHIIWKIRCNNPENIKTLTTSFFKLFPKAEEIEVEVVSASGQKAIEWENNENSIELP